MHILLVLPGVLACIDLTRPTRWEATPQSAVGPVLLAQPAPQSAHLSAAQGTPISRTPAPPIDGRISASHILVSYHGALRAPPTTSRTREQALERARRLARKARSPKTDFSALARRVSDGPSAPAGGELGSFTRQQMVAAFSDAAFALDVGEISEVVETEFGFHIIKRTR